MQRHRLTDEQWNRIKLLVLGKDGDPGRHGGNDRLFVDAILWLAKTGAPWRDLPRECGNWNSIFGGFHGGRSVGYGLGNPLRIILSPGQDHDSTKAEELIADIPAEHVIADKAYDTDKTAAAFLAFVNLACLMVWLR